MPDAMGKAQQILSTQIQLQDTWKSGHSLICSVTMGWSPSKREGEKQPVNLMNVMLPLEAWHRHAGPLACPLHPYSLI